MFLEEIRRKGKWTNSCGDCKQAITIPTYLLTYVYLHMYATTNCQTSIARYIVIMRCCFSLALRSQEMLFAQSHIV